MSVVRRAGLPHFGDGMSGSSKRLRSSLNALPKRKVSNEDTIVYALVCEQSSGTTGKATWRIGEHVIRGTLDVKLGGKNMTFFQRVTAKVIGDCPSVG